MAGQQEKQRDMPNIHIIEFFEFHSADVLIRVPGVPDRSEPPLGAGLTGDEVIKTSELQRDIHLPS